MVGVSWLKMGTLVPVMQLSRPVHWVQVCQLLAPTGIPTLLMINGPQWSDFGFISVHVSC